MKTIFLATIMGLSLLIHPIKMSFSKMSIDKKGKVELETRLFLDDLTLHIESKYRLKQANFSTLSANGSKALQDYMHKCLYIIQSGRSMHFTITDISLSEDNLALVVRMESDQPLNRNIPYQIKNTLLFDIFKKQKNLMILEDEKHHKFYFTIDEPLVAVDNRQKQ